jgi:ADP-heptose:LPS heptosyltransferase
MSLAAAAARITTEGFQHGHAIYDTNPTLREDAALIAAAANDPSNPGPGLEALFSGIIEPWSDSFKPLARDAYGTVFSDIIWRSCQADSELMRCLRNFGIHGPEDLEAGWLKRRSNSLPWPEQPKRIAVLSRVTLGADILLVSPLLQHLRERYPEAEISLLGAGKLHDLFGDFPGLRLQPVTYQRRGPLRERLRSWLTILAASADADLIISPDSRLDQLGVLPMTSDPARHRLWENTLPDGQAVPLAERLDRWCQEQLHTPSRSAQLWPSSATQAIAQSLRQAQGERPLFAVKLDVGGNRAKALPEEYERELLQTIVAQGWRVIMDRGFGDEELAASDRLLASLGWEATDLADDAEMGLPPNAWTPAALATGDCLRVHGTIGTWAGAVLAAQQAFSYDSVGQHLAAAAGCPVIVGFAGFADDRFPTAWRPSGKNSISTVCYPPANLDDLLTCIPPAPPVLTTEN